jgi:hypothetical protein
VLVLMSVAMPPSLALAALCDAGKAEVVPIGGREGGVFAESGGGGPFFQFMAMSVMPSPRCSFT